MLQLIYKVAMNFLRKLFSITLIACSLLGMTSHAMCLDKKIEQLSGPSNAQTTMLTPVSQDDTEHLTILYGTQENMNTSVPPPQILRRYNSENNLNTEQSQFIVTYIGFTDEAQEAFQYAVDIWDSLIRTQVPIRINASFIDFGGFENNNIILGGARPADWKSPGSLNLWFVDALSDMQAGKDLSDGAPDIITKFNSNQEVNWYFGIDGNTPSGKMDFVSTVIHEIAHGLGFSSFARIENSSNDIFSLSVAQGTLRGKSPKFPQIYDFFVENGSGTALISFFDPSSGLVEQFTSNNIYWNGKIGVKANGGILPHLYAPSIWEQGSSYTHLDEDSFPAGDENSLMTPYFGRQEAIHNPGSITLGMLEDMGWSINKAPVFVDGTNTTRTLVENAGSDVNIGRPIFAMDDNNDNLTYQLSGTDAALFVIDSTTGQVKTNIGQEYNRTSYTVTVIVSDGRLITEIIVIIQVSTTTVVTPNNNPPIFTDGSHTTRTVVENTTSGVDIGDPITATDADNHYLTYTLSGVDAALFEINDATGQLKTKVALDYETNRTYTVTLTVSDGSLTDTITVTINVTDKDVETTPTLTLISHPLMETTLNGSLVTLKLNHSVYENWLINPVTVSGIPGVTVKTSNVVRAADTELRLQLTFDGTDFDTNATLTFTVKTDAIENYSDSPLKATILVTAAQESVNASTITPPTETTLNGTVVTLTLSGAVYESKYTVGNNVSVSGITGVSVNRLNVVRISGTQVNVALKFDGTDFDSNAMLTITVGADAIASYNGTELVAQLPVIAVVEENPSIIAFVSESLTETTLNESLVTLTLSSDVYMQSSSVINRSIQVSGIAGVTVRQSDVARVSDTKVTVKITYDGTNFDTDSKLIFTVTADAIENYTGPALISVIPVTAVIESKPTVTVVTSQPLTEANLNENVILLTLNNGTYVQSLFDIEDSLTVSGISGVTLNRYGVRRVSDTDISVELEFDGNFDSNAILTFSVGADAIVGYEGADLIIQLPVAGGQETLIASTAAPLTEVTLNGSVVTLTINGAIFKRSRIDIGNAITVSGVNGVTFHWFDIDRVSDTNLTVELSFNGNIDEDATLTFTVGADAIAGYDGDALITQLPVTALQESVSATTESSLAEATLDGSIVTLTLSGCTFERSLFNIRNGVTVSGVDGVKIYSFGIDRVSDTQINVELEFNGDFDTDATLTFTVGVNAILRYNGDPLTAQLTVTGGQETVIASTAAPLTEVTLNGSVVTLTLSGAKYTRNTFDLRDGVSVSGIEGVIIPWHDPRKKSDTEITIELEFDGTDFDTTSTLTFTVESDAFAGYNGPALTTQISVSEVVESLLASSASPLTEATLDESVVTLTLIGRNYTRTIYDIRDAVSVSGISGVTFPWNEPVKKSDTEITMKLEFDGDMTSDGTLTFTVGSDAIAGYNGSVLTAQVSVSATSTTTPSNRAPVFTEGSSTTRSVAENTASGVNIGSVVAATDADTGDTLTYSLGGTNASAFSIVSNSGQLQTKAALDYETMTSYSVIISVTDGRGGSDSITVAINITDVNEAIPNRAPIFTEGSSTTRSVAENTASGVNIGSAVAATDADRNTLTYSLGGTNASAFSIVSNSGQLQTKAALDYETMTSYSVIVSVTDGNGGSDSIIVTINITDVSETPTNGRPSISVSADTTLTEATLDGTVVTLTLTSGTYESAFWNYQKVSVSGITGVTFNDFFDVERASSTELTVELTFDGNMTTDGTLTFTVESDAIVDFDDSALTAQISVSAVSESVTASPATLTEASLDGAKVTLTLSGQIFERSIHYIRDAVSVSGISGVTFPWHDPDKKSDTEITMELEFDGDMTSDGTLTFMVGADAIAGYNGSALTAQVSVTASQENALGANFPNPFNPETWIPYQLSKASNVSLTIYNMRGVVVRESKLGQKAAGVYQSRSRAIHWDGRNEIGEKVASGLYFYTLTAGDFTATRKMLIRK